MQTKNRKFCYILSNTNNSPYLHKIPSILISIIVTQSIFTNLHAANRLYDVIKDSTLEGRAFVRHHTMHGRDGGGTKYQFFFKPTLTTGELYGFSGSAGIMFFKGGGTADSSNTHNDISGSRGDMHASYSDRFNIGDFYITYNAKEQFKTNTILRLGQKTPGTPFNDNNLDRALGLFFENKDLKYANFTFQFWDTWMGDDMFCSRNTGSINNQPGVNSQVGFGNNVFLLGIKSDSEFTKDTGLAYNLWYAYINRYIDAMTFADISYTAKFNNHSLTLLGQISYTALTNNPRVLSGDKQYSELYSNSKYNYAKTRGMYNIRLDYKMNFMAEDDLGESKPIGFIGAAAGFAGSFANGFGTLIDNTGGLKLGGMLWGGFSKADANGFGIIGVGGFDKSSIKASYITITGNYKRLTTALDLAYIDATHFYLLKKASANAEGQNLNTVPNHLFGSANYIRPIKFFETSISILYQFTSSISASLHYTHFFGGLDLGRLRLQINYLL